MEQNIPEKWKNLRLEFKEEFKPKTIFKNKKDVNKKKDTIECNISFCDNKKTKCIIL